MTAGGLRLIGAALWLSAGLGAADGGMSLDALASLGGDDLPAAADVDAPRLTALRDGGMRIGAQHGFAWGVERLDVFLEAQSRALDGIFDFGALMRRVGDGRLAPPVIREARGTMTATSGRRLVLDGQTYDLVRPAELVAAPPNWREYFDLLGGPEVGLPDKAVLPQDADERVVWANAVGAGWRAGVAQAEREYMDRLARLRADFVGMLTYWRLVREGRMVQPVVRVIRQSHLARSNELVLDRTVLVIEGEAVFASPRDWVPELLLGRQEDAPGASL